VLCGMSCPTIRPPTLAADVFGHRSTSRVSAAHLYTMPGTGSVNTAVDLEEGLKYLKVSERFARPTCQVACISISARNRT
jgi:hypothetical protein